jgi:predicted P-loop ATPase
MGHPKMNEEEKDINTILKSIDKLQQSAKALAEKQTKISEQFKTLQWIREKCVFEKEFSKSYLIYKDNKLEISDAAYLKVWTDVICDNIRAKKSEVKDMMDNELESAENKDLCFFLKQTKWDGQSRVMPFMKDFFMNNRDPHIETKLRAFLIQCIRRIFSPGCNAPYMLILAGKGGVGKSLLAKFLGGDLDATAKKSKGFSDASLDFENDKRAGELLKGKFIHELGELRNFNKADMNSLKQFVTRNEDCYRPSYGTTVVEQKRLTNFIGTTNEPKFLRDLDGLRRYIVISTTRDVDNPYTRAILEMDFWQFWAEVISWYNELSPSVQDSGINIDSIIDKDALNYIKFDQEIEDNILNFVVMNFDRVEKHRCLSSVEISAYLCQKMRKSLNYQEISKFMRHLGFNFGRAPIMGKEIGNVWEIDKDNVFKLKKTLFVE